MPQTAKSDPEAVWWLYFLLYGKGRVYVGISPDPVRRFREHCRQHSANTRMNRPLALIGAYMAGSYAIAIREERSVKRLPHMEKLALAAKSRQSKPWEHLVAAQNL